MKILSDEEIKSIDTESYKKAIKWSKQHDVSLSARHWNPNRSADRRRYWDSQFKTESQREVARAQLNSCEDEAKAQLERIAEEIDNNLLLDINDTMYVPNEFLCIGIRKWQSLKEKISGGLL